MATKIQAKRINLSTALVRFDRDMERLGVGLDACESLSALRSEIAAQDVIDEPTATLLTISVESLLTVARIGTTSSALGMPSLEGYQTQYTPKEQCLERFDDGIRKILSGIIEALKKAFRWIFGLTDKLGATNDQDRALSSKLLAYAQKLENSNVERDSKKPLESSLIRLEETRSGFGITIKTTAQVNHIYRDKLLDAASLSRIAEDAKAVAQAIEELDVVYKDTRGYVGWNSRLIKGFRARNKDDLHKRLTNNQDLALYLSSPIGYRTSFYIVTSLNVETVTLDRYVHDFNVGMVQTDVKKPQDTQAVMSGSLVKNYREVAELFAKLVEVDEQLFSLVEKSTQTLESFVAQLEAQIKPNDTAPDVLKKTKDILMLAKKLQTAPLLKLCKQIEVLKIQTRTLAQGLHTVI